MISVMRQHLFASLSVGIIDEFTQKCFSKICNSDRCRLYKDIKTELPQFSN